MPVEDTILPVDTGLPPVEEPTDLESDADRKAAFDLEREQFEADRAALANERDQFEATVKQREISANDLADTISALADAKLEILRLRELIAARVDAERLQRAADDEAEAKRVAAIPARPVDEVEKRFRAVSGNEVRARVSIANSHVGTIECSIPVNTPPNERVRAALKAAGKVRGIAEGENGMPQFGGAPTVDFLEN